MPIPKPDDEQAEQTSRQQEEQEMEAQIKEMREARRQRIEDAKERIRARGQRQAEEPARTYTVQAGDTLAKIAQKLYEDGGRWTEIYEANKDQIADPNVIEVGQKLVIP
jgi:nucleoid-associated protein YgaU